jgi:hypothetical protein
MGGILWQHIPLQLGDLKDPDLSTRQNLKGLPVALKQGELNHFYQDPEGFQIKHNAITLKF